MREAIMIRTTLCIWLSCVAAAGASLRAAPVDATGVDFFERRIRPLFAAHCYECHGGGRTKGGLALDSREALLRGGNSGAAIVPGDPGQSRLIEAVRYTNRDLQMPPRGPLKADEIRDLETWIKMGAPDPREAAAARADRLHGIDLAAGRRFWSFAPLADPALPGTSEHAWVATPVDAFVLRDLQRAGLAPAPPADKRTLIRRVTFDLTGLPPTTDEVEAFLADPGDDAFGRVIERLLASPHYGERWGRHWLDVARYADSNGLDENIAYGHAWRYRDYVVRSFNEDQPYDEFLVQQIAGDLLPATSEAERIENLTGTGFLALGARVLAEPDVRKMEMDVIDEQIDTLGKAFLGMTLGCCRCHDHKFDPIATADYYALAAIFRSTKSLADDRMGAVKFWYEHSLATPEQREARKKHEAAVKSLRDKVTKHNTEMREKLKGELQAQAADYLAAAAELPADADFARIQQLAGERRLRARYLLTCRQYLASHPDHPVFARWRELTAAGQYAAVRSYYASLFAEAIAAWKAAQSQKDQAKATPSDRPEGSSPKAKDSKVGVISDERLAAAMEALQDKAGFLAIPDKDADAFDPEALAVIERMRAELASVEDRTPDPPALMGVTEGTITRSLAIHHGGSYLSLGQEVPRGFPAVMQTSLSSPIFPARQSGRLQLARWMASSDHPLTARVIVNRLWRWHFGTGIVRTTENFGALGDKPSHPDLLDWLARRFIEDGWSIKNMHRLLLKSSTYQMASTHPAAGKPGSRPDPALLDPENRLLWRANIQRLDAEQIFDALFAVSGSLELRMGGKTVPLRNRQYVFDHTSIDATRYETTRRAVYLPLIRNHLYDMLEQFDYPDPTVPTGSRNATVVPPQALLMLNSPVIRDAAERLARRLFDEFADDEARIRHAYAAVFARAPAEREVRRGLEFVTTRADRHEAWTVLCHTLLASNEFLYLQ